MSASGTSTSCTFWSVKSKARSRVPDWSLRVPSRRDCSMMPATSLRVKVLVASSLGSTWKSRSTPLAMPLRTAITGRKSRETATSGGARRSAARSGTENDRFFGTISPNTTCR